MALTLTQYDVEYFLRDPVAAAAYFFPIELDVHQRVRLRLMWFVPELQDDSGIFTGKTLVGWIWCQLRCILLPSPAGFDPRIVGVFYQDIASAKSIFKPYYDKFISESPRFRKELKRTQGKTLGYRPAESGFEYLYKNGNKVFVPAIGIKEDAAKIASLRVHDGMVEEAKEIEKKSDALDNQILSRVNAKVWNPNHPVFANHKVLMGHAEDPATHPGYKRHKAAKAAIRDGDQEIAIITSNFRDWTPRFVAMGMRKDKEIRMARRTMSPAKFAQRYGGIWEYGTEDWYEAIVLGKCQTPLAHVTNERGHPDEIFSLGVDSAGGANMRADWNAQVLWRAKRVPQGARVSDTTGYFLANGVLWEISPTWAWQGKRKDGGQISGLIHRGHRRFSFARITYDPGGGGLWMVKELPKPQQFFDDREQQVAGICAPEDSGLWPQASPILIRWSKGSTDLAHAWEESRYLKSDDGIIEAIHMKAQEMFYSRSIRWPISPEDMPRRDFEALDQEQRKSLAFLNMTLLQFMNIKVEMVTRNGEDTPKMTAQGFRSFRAVGKKDLAYAALYGLAGLLALLNDPEQQHGSGEQSGCIAVG